MSFLNRSWFFYKSDEQLAEEISKNFKINKLTAQVLLNRGLQCNESIQVFLSPRLSYLKDPFELPDMKIAIKRTLKAIKNDEKIFVWGDYDTDGVTGTSILAIGLRKLNASVNCYIPHRYDEGYGLNEKGIRQIAENGGKLIITVDCGISNHKEIEYAKNLGVDVIVTDHHNLPQELPEAIACVNPKRLFQGHPSRDLSGAGVAFKFIWALFRCMGIKDSKQITEFLDLAALGTIADVVPLLNENRILAVSGIKLLNQKRRTGFKHLFEVSKLNGDINERNISFVLAPRLNAPGRLRHAELSLKLLLEEDPKKAKIIADEINIINAERQQIGSLIGDEIFSKVDDIESKKLLILSGKNWHPGVLGIIAARLSEKFNRPTILISDNGITCRGSARGIEGVDIFDLLSSCKDIFIDFGGHKDAAGFEMPSESIEELKYRLTKKFDGYCSFEELIPKTKIDAEALTEDITYELAEEVEKLAPFGQNNPNPVFATKNLEIISSSQVGSKGEHLKLVLSDKKNKNLNAIGFNLGNIYNVLKRGMIVDIAYNISLDEWNGIVNPKIQLIDIRRANR